jgi:hypothetical protein
MVGQSVSYRADYLRPLRIVGDRRDQAAEKLVDFGRSRKVHGLCQFILWAVVSNRVPLGKKGIAKQIFLGMRSGVVNSEAKRSTAKARLITPAA